MSDVVDIATNAVLVYLGASGLKVAMAPAEAVAEEWKGRILGRLHRVREKAEAKAVDGLLQPPDRVAFKALTEAAITDDEIAAEYLAGVLVASGADSDDGTPVIAQIGRLSAYQLRFHYILYREVRRLWPRGASLNLYQETEATRAGIRFPLNDLLSALGTRGSFASVLPTLHREGLISGAWRTGPESSRDPSSPWSAEARPSALGAELFLWGHGVRELDANALFKPDLELTFLTEVAATPGASLISSPASAEQPAGS